MSINNNKKYPLIAIVGPTSSGKSALAVHIARRYNGEIISADSRQVYRGLDVGSGKITKREMHGIPHHLLDVLSPRRTYTVAQYKRDGRRVISAILRRRKLPVICGGTGFYLQALLDGIVIPKVSPDTQLRKKLEQKSPQELLTTLRRLDPQRVKTIDVRNKRRLIRSIEVAKALGSVPPFRAKPLPNPLLFLGMMLDDDILKKRIALRIKGWLRSGLRAEVRALLRAGISQRRIRSFGLVYARALDLTLQRISRSDFEEGLSRDMWRYARRQKTWFRRDRRIHWVRSQREGLLLVKQFLKDSA